MVVEKKGLPVEDISGIIYDTLNQGGFKKVGEDARKGMQSFKVDFTGKVGWSDRKEHKFHKKYHGKTQ